MTLDEFMDALSKTPREWWLAGSVIRCARGDCPLTAVMRLQTGKSTSVGNFYLAARMIGLAEDDALDVVDAADFKKLRPELRARLLKACGLTP